MRKAKRVSKKVVTATVLQEGTVDLRQCIEGDILISKHDKSFKYLEPTPLKHFDHNIINIHGEIKSISSRTHNGQEMRKNRSEGDHDIVKVIRETVE